MNDFTKEELNLITNGLYLLDTYFLGKHLDTKNLSNKIESMIDNYCQHHYVFRCHD